MKKLLIPIVALLAFSMLSTFVSANNGDYYMASFYGEGCGRCWVRNFVKAEEYIGKGSAHVRGLAIVYEDFGTYRASRLTDPNTRLWTRRTRMTASWNNEKLTVWMWPSYQASGEFRDDSWLLGNLSYFGYYTGESLHFISGTANIYCGPESPQIILQVILRVETENWILFMWSNEEWDSFPVAREFRYGKTIWGPIPWHPSGP